MTIREPYAVVGNCRLCGQGRLIVAKETTTSDLYILCEECESEWESPDATVDSAKATLMKHGQSTLLTREDLATHAWRRFLISY